MFNWIKTQALKISILVNFILIIICAAIIAYFVVFGKGISIDRSSHSSSTSTSISSSSSGSIAIGFIGDSVKGSVVEHVQSFTTFTDLSVFRQGLSVSQKLISNVTYNSLDNRWYIFYSSFEDSKDVVTQTRKTEDNKQVQDTTTHESK